MDYEFTIVGGGIVGLATALQLIRRKPGIRIAVLEKESAVARHQTGHNSGVIHSGLYYKPGSLKAKNCVAGALAMVEFCREQGIPYEICGKVVVATDQPELPGLDELKRRGIANGVPGLTMIPVERLRELEPNCTGIAALYVPGTGIVNYALVAQSMRNSSRQEAVRSSRAARFRALHKVGAKPFWRRPVARSRPTGLSTVPACTAIGSCVWLERTTACALSRFAANIMRIVPARRKLVRNLIYPVADPRFPFLGVHFTRRISGGIEAGPNAVLALKREGYRKTDFNLKDAVETALFPGFWKMAAKYWQSGMGEYYRSLNKQAFTRALQKLVPDIKSEDLEPAGAGVRAQAVDSTGRLLDDFSIVQSKQFIHVCNVPSPAATASLVIGKQIAEIALE